MKNALIMAVVLTMALPPVVGWGAGSSAILGTEDYFVGALPPPGFHFINYLAYYNAGKIKDSEGDKLPVDFQADILAEVLRGIFISDVKVLDADLGWHVILPVVYQGVKIKEMGKGVYNFGLGDMYFSPFILGWHSEIFHWVFGLDIIAPTGQYDKDQMASIGNKHWTFEPAFAVSMIHPSGFDVDLKLMYDIHTKNTDELDPALGKVDYLTGQQFHFDYNVGFQVIDGLRLGACGYFLKGLQDDKIDGEKVPDSKEQVFALGPSALYSFNPGLHLVAKVQFEMAAKNRPEGTFSWLKLIYSF